MKDNKESEEYSYKVMMDGLQKSRAWSVASIAVAVASVELSASLVGYAGFIYV